MDSWDTINTLQRRPWHGISAGDDLALIDSPEGLAVISAMHLEEVAYKKVTASPRVGIHCPSERRASDLLFLQKL